MFVSAENENIDFSRFNSEDIFIKDDYKLQKEENGLFFEDNNFKLSLNNDYDQDTDLSLYKTTLSSTDQTLDKSAPIFHIEKVKKKQTFDQKLENVKKLLLNKKKLRELNQEKKYIIIDDKVIRLSKSLTLKEKKEIKTIRNRISAQKSRDNKKLEFEELKKENKRLKDLVKEQQDIIDELERRRVICDRCRSTTSSTSNSDSTYYISQSNSPQTSPHSLFIGSICLVGVFLLLMLFGGAHQRNSNHHNLKFTPRILLSNPDESLSDNMILSVLNEKYPVGHSSMTKEELNHIYRLRENFLINIYKSIYPNQSKNFLSENTLPIKYHYPACVNKVIVNDNTKVRVKSENNTLPIHSNGNFVVDEFKKHVQSLYIKDYIAINFLNDQTSFEDILNSPTKEDECSYLHILFPGVKKDEIEYKERPLYYEVGCKILEINKVEK